MQKPYIQPSWALKRISTEVHMKSPCGTHNAVAREYNDWISMIYRRAKRRDRLV